MDSFCEDISRGYDPVLEVNAFFDDLLTSMIVGEMQTFDISVDQGSWRMFGMAFWNKSDGVFDFSYLGLSDNSPHVMGSCSYKIFSYRTQLRIGEQILLHEDVQYAPELGVVLGRTPLDQDGTPRNTRWFSSISLE